MKKVSLINASFNQEGNKFSVEVLYIIRSKFNSDARLTKDTIYSYLLNQFTFIEVLFQSIINKRIKRGKNEEKTAFI